MAQSHPGPGHLRDRLPGLALAGRLPSRRPVRRRSGVEAVPSRWRRMTGTTALTAGRPDPGEAGREAETDGREPTRPGSTPLKRLLGWYALSRLVTLAAAIAAGIRYPGFGLIRFFSAWDAGWYLKLIASGYPHGIPQVAGRATEGTIGFLPF